MIKDYGPRPAPESVAERQFLQRRLDEVERALGRAAADLGTPTPITQGLDALDRARELVSDMSRQVQVRPLEEAIASHLAWLDRAEAQGSPGNGEPKVAFNRIALDRRLLADLLAGWQSARR
jgi:hypothetical protein